MPFGDRTGPEGRGPMTGRGAGYCSDANAPGNVAAYGTGRGFGRGFGRGARFGFGRGFGRGRGGWGQGGGFFSDPVRDTAMPVISREQEVDTLKAQAKGLQDTLQRINDRLDKLENQE